MRALVAGGAGFVGSHLCRALLDVGYEVACADNLSTGRAANIADLRTRAGFEFYVTDITGTEDQWGGPLDVIFHLASPASPVDYDRLPLETLRANSTGTWNLLHTAWNHRASFIYASTSEVYGDPLVHPQPETYWGNVDPIGPRSCYDEGKRFSEALVTAYRTKHVPAAIVRIFNTYGPSMRLDDGRVIPAFIDAALAGRALPIQGLGYQTRSYLYVADLVSALLRVAADPKLDGLVLNVGNPHELTVLELASRVLAATSRPLTDFEFVPARRGDPRQRRPDISRITARYGWAPTVPLDEGLRRTIEWARSI